MPPSNRARSTVTRRTGLAEVAVDDNDSISRPAEGHRTFPKRVLALGALGVLEHLAQGALTDVRVCLPLQMTRCHLLVSEHIGAHHSTLHRLIAISASNDANSVV
jgi:hypothetical protein